MRIEFNFKGAVVCVESNEPVLPRKEPFTLLTQDEKVEFRKVISEKCKEFF